MENQSAADAIRLLLLTGARRSEVLGAQWEEFNLERGIWIKPAGRVKSRKRTSVPLSERAQALLARMSESAAGTYLFPNKKGDGPVPDIKRPWAWLMAETGIQDFRIHDLRHTHASILVSQGLSLELIGKLLGHTQAQTTMRYAHLMDDPLREALRASDAAIASAGTAKEP
jgi:integrase